MLFQRSHIAALAQNLARDHQVYLGTSSWRYPGWCGLLYDEDRYLWGTHFSTTQASQPCSRHHCRVRAVGDMGFTL